MGVIKTALEIALEKTDKVKGDKSSISQFEAKQRGKKLANAFLAEKSINLAEELKKAPVSEKESLKQGVFDILVTHIALPSVKDDESASGQQGTRSLSKMEKLGTGLEAVIKDKQFTAMYNQLLQVVTQYLQEMSHYEQAIRKQYAPKLRQKEEEISRRLGREVRLDPLQDPEFVTFYNQHMTALKANYDPVVEQAKEETKRMFSNA